MLASAFNNSFFATTIILIIKMVECNCNGIKQVETFCNNYYIYMEISCAFLAHAHTIIFL